MLQKIAPKLFKKYNAVIIIIILMITNSLFAQSNIEMQENLNTKTGLSRAMINEIVRDSNGGYWIATERNGLHFYNFNKHLTFNSQNGLKTDDVLSIKSLNDEIYVGTLDAGFSLIKNYKIIKSLQIPSILSNSVYDIKLTQRNIILACKGSGVQYLEYKTFTPNGVNKNIINPLSFYKYNNTDIIGTSKKGFYANNKFIDTNNSYFSFCQYQSFLIGGTIKSGIKIYNKKFEEQKICDNKDLNEYFITNVKQINNYLVISGKDFYFTKYKNKKIETEFTYPLKTRSILKDNNRLLISTEEDGVYVFKLDPFLKKEIEFNDKEFQIINTIYFLDNELYVVNNKSDLYKFNTKGEQKEYLYNNKTADVLEFTKIDNTILICTSKGIAIKGASKNNIVKNILNNEELKYSEVNNITKTTDKIFISSNAKGLFVCDKDKISKYNLENQKLPDNNIFVMYTDSKQNVWCGFDNKGIVKIDNNLNFSYLNTSNGLVSNSIQCFAEYKNGILIGTKESGIQFYDGKKFKHINEQKNNILSNNVSSLLVDKLGYIWIGTSNNGISRIKVNENFDVIFTRNYDKNKGFEATDISKNGIAQTSGGDIYIATNRGLLKYVNDFETPNLEMPKLVLDEVQLLNKTIDWNTLALKTPEDNIHVPIEFIVNYETNNLTFKFHSITLDPTVYATKLISSQNNADDWSDFSEKNEVSYNYLPPGEYILLVKSKNSHHITNKNLLQYKFIIKPPFYKTLLFISLSIITLLSALILYFRWRTKALQNQNKQLEEAVDIRTQELSVSNNRLSHALGDITDSINYAKRLQDAILPAQEKINKYFPKSLLLFKPRDIVSGDFYWCAQQNIEEQELNYLVMADCTGHGVPGAFMSMIGTDKLNNIINERQVTNLQQIVGLLNKGVKQLIQQNAKADVKQQDGMDVGILKIIYNKEKNTASITFVGANRPLWIIRKDNSFEEIKPDKTSIGGYTPIDYIFTSHSLELNEGDRAYIFSDGYPDQFGGDNNKNGGKKFMTKKLREILIENNNDNLNNIYTILNNAFINWQGNEPQVDDVLFWGIEV